MKAFHTNRFHLFALAIAALPPSLDAKLPASDGFSYPTGNLAGAAGGAGWLGPWTASATSPLKVGPGLIYQGYATIGGSLLDDGGSARAGARRWFNPAVNIASGTAIWFSCLARYDTSHNSDMMVLPFGEKGKESEGCGIAINTRPTANASTLSDDPHVFIRKDAGNVGIGGSSTGAGLAAAAGPGRTILIVGRFTLSEAANSDALDVWVNQTEPPSGEAPLRLTGFTATRTPADSDGSLLVYQGNSARGAIDEIRVGLTYADVTTGLKSAPVPTVALTFPAPGTSFAASAPIPLAAEVTANGRSISRVRFHDGATLLGEATREPIEFLWTGASPSSPQVTAQVIYDGGLAASSAVVPITVYENRPVTFAIDTASNRRHINPHIYGVNNISEPADLEELNYTINRRGGEVESRYDWKTNSHNIAHNWYFTSSKGSGEPGADVSRYIKATFDAKADVIVAIPTIGWMPKPGTWSFSIKKYGEQEKHEPYGSPDAGNGIRFVDGKKIELSPNHPDRAYRTNPTEANYMPADPLAYQAGYVDHLIKTWGPSAKSGVRYYALDNEPGLWDSTHRDVRGGAQPSKEEILDYIIRYGAMIKDRDPGAIIMAADEWGWLDWKQYYPWLLEEMQAHHKKTGRRILDILTLHYYAAVEGPDGSVEKLLSLNRSTRSLWDPAWKDKSWINTEINLIPTMREWIAKYYPGTKIGMTEYNWGYDEDIAGAVIQAEVLGIFGREGMDLATRWGSSANKPSNIVFKAMKIYRNYDGKKSTFGDTSVSVSTSANPDDVNAFAAERSSDKALTIMAVNKQPSGVRTASFPITGFTPGGAIQAFRLDAGNAITRLADLPLSGTSFTAVLPAQSITLFILKPAVTHSP